VEWKKYKKRIESGGKLSEKSMADFVSADILLKKLGIDMEKEYQESKKFEEALSEIFK